MIPDAGATQQQKIEELMGIRLAFASLIDLKDSYTAGHSTHVSALTRKFLESIKASSTEIEAITTAAELHDIGKIGIPDSVLQKPGKLNEEEYFAIKKHPVTGADAVKSLHGFNGISKIILHHHERYDGTGYPDGLSGDNIPFESRVLSVIDAYDAMIYTRPYRKAMKRTSVIKVLEEGAGKQFDPLLVTNFSKLLQRKDIYSEYDPVCGMVVNPQHTFFNVSYKKHSYIFCSQVCLTEFNNFPEKYIDESRKNN